jgi:purine-binding chemotaxis protein CheW
MGLSQKRAGASPALTNATIEGGAVVDLTGKYLIFKLADREYGIEISKTKVVIGDAEITGLRYTHPFVCGAVIFQDESIPVIDLRRKFKMDAGGTNETCIIVIEYVGSMGENILNCILVDSVYGIFNIHGKDIEEAPASETNIDAAFILGAVKAEGSVKILLDIEKVLSSTELENPAGDGSMDLMHSAPSLNCLVSGL